MTHNRYPRPLEFKVAKHATGLTIVTLTMDNESAATCRRCATCRAVSSPSNPDRLVCANVLPTTHSDDFLFGPIDETTDVPACACPESSPASVKSSTRWQPDAGAIDEMARDLDAASREEKEFWDAGSRHVDDAGRAVEEEALDKVLDKTHETVLRAAQIVSKVCGHVERDDLTAIAVESNEHLLAVVPTALVETLWNTGTLIFPIPKTAVVKAHGLE